VCACMRACCLHLHDVCPYLYMHACMRGHVCRGCVCVCLCVFTSTIWCVRRRGI